MQLTGAWTAIRLSRSIQQQHWLCCSCETQNINRLQKLHNENLHSLYLCPNTAMVIKVKGCKRLKGEEQWVSNRTCLQNSDTKWHISSDTDCEHTPHIRSRGGLLWWWWWTSVYSVCWFPTNTHRLSYPAEGNTSNERHAIQHFQTRMAHLVQHHYAHKFIMQHWADIRLGGQ